MTTNTKLSWNEHTASCNKRQKEYKNTVADFTARFPTYCRTCRGWGTITYQDDPSPAGVGLSPGTMEFIEPCPKCVELGHCQQCMSRGLNIDGTECQDCGWHYREGEDNPDPPGLEEQPDCGCYDHWVSQAEEIN